MPALPEIISEPEIKPYTVIRLSKDTIQDLASLHSAVYAAVAEDHYSKKYDTAYTGVSYTGFIAYDLLHQPIAYYGVLPCFIQHENEVMLAAQSADTMTHPAYRYKGMFVELSKLTFALCRELGILLLFGFPNENSYIGAVNKLGWQLVNTMSCFTIRIKAFPLAWFASKKHFLKKLYHRYAGIVLKNKLIADRILLNSVLNDGFAGIYRNEEYQQYKQGFSNSKLIQIDNVKIRISLRQVLLIGDIEGMDEKNFETVISQLKNLSLKLGLKEIQFHCSPDISLHRLFENAFAATPSYPVLFQDFGSPIPLHKIKFTFGDIDIF